jgi:thiol-disulfide isomerase/thioredoxin
MDNGYDTQANAEGRFTFDRVVPGPGNLSRQLVAKHPGGLTSFSPGWYSTLDVPPGATVEATVGGRGRAVVGRVVESAKPEQPIDWSRNDPLVLFNHEPDQSVLPGASGGQAMFFAGLDEEGRFRIDDVPPGTYRLQLSVDPPATALSRGSGNPIGAAVVEVVVPEGPDGEPVDLGEVVAEIWPALKVDEMAPEFTAITTGGGSFKLSDRRGKFVLLDFWATWCGPCLAAMPEMKELHAAFGGDGRFEMVGLACDEGIGAPALKSRELGLGWTQVFIGPLAEGVGAAYHVRSIPATFLIGPDGRILAKNLRGAELREAVRKALEE